MKPPTERVLVSVRALLSIFVQQALEGSVRSDRLKRASQGLHEQKSDFGLPARERHVEDCAKRVSDSMGVREPELSVAPRESLWVPIPYSHALLKESVSAHGFEAGQNWREYARPRRASVLGEIYEREMTHWELRLGEMKKLLVLVWRLR
jgi:hypothetical protein